MQGEQVIRGGEQLGLRAYNKRMILGLIRQTGALPKAEIARLTGLSAQAAPVIVNGLLKERLVRKEKKVRGRVRAGPAGPQGHQLLRPAPRQHRAATQGLRRVDAAAHPALRAGSSTAG